MIDIETATPTQLEEALYKLAHECTKKDAENVKAQEDFDLLHDAKKIIFAKLMGSHPCKTIAESERQALISSEWGEWMKGYQVARQKAAVAKLESDAHRRLWDTARSILSSKNTERRQFGS